MWLRVLAICLTLVATVVHGSQFKKCCPAGEIVHEDSLGDNSVVPRFSCQKQLVSVKIKTKRESESYEFENAVNSRGMVTYNVLSDSKSHWPDCTSGFLTSTIITHSLKANVTSSCVDIMNGDYYLFACDDLSKVSTNSKSIYNIRKCCANNYTFDIFSRRCIVANEIIGDMNEHFNFFGNKSVIFDIGIPNCKPDDVLIEYRDDLHKLKIYETSLIITATETHGPDVFIHGSYCIENAISSNRASDSNLKWISKVCRPKDICSEIPCLRKCCKESLRMVIQNGSTFCEPHDQHLKVNLHLFNGEASPEIPEKIEPTGMHLSIRLSVPKRNKIMYKNR